jgi:hypothetical protein
MLIGAPNGGAAGGATGAVCACTTPADNTTQTATTNCLNDFNLMTPSPFNHNQIKHCIACRLF